MPKSIEAPSPTELQQQLDDNRQRVDVDHYDITISELSRMARDDELTIAPEYQRHFRWDELDESRLIESLFLGLPVPAIYVATNDDATWEVIDGLQRLSTVFHFVGEEDLLELTGKPLPLALQGLEELDAFNGLKFDQLPGPIRLAFTRRSLRVTALSDKSDFEARFDLFERLNRGGVTLTPQEVRACIFRGEFNDLLRSLAHDSTFVPLVKLQKGAQKDGTREELILKFFAYKNNRPAFKGKVTHFLNDYMAKHAPALDITTAEDLFKSVVMKLSEITDGGPFLREGVKSTPLNQLEAVLVALGEIFEESRQAEIGPQPGWENDSELVRASTGGTNTAAMLRARIDRSRALLLGSGVDN